MGTSLEARFARYGETIVAALGHADRAVPATWYLQGLMLPGGRKSVEPMAARVRPINRCITWCRPRTGATKSCWLPWPSRYCRP